LEIRAAISGEPEAYLDAAPLPVSISISHRAGVALCTVAPGGAEIGCDLELVEERSEAFVTDYFTVEEQALVARTPASERPLLLNLLWSAKESALKALHEGLRLDTRYVNVDIDLSARGRDKTAWEPLHVRLSNGGEFCGRWRQGGSTLRTIVARASSLEIFPITLALTGANCHTEFPQHALRMV
jgi:4'-phosphopantetheinyl transferase